MATPSSSTGENSLAAKGNNNFALTVLTTLFFMMGFITCMNDILIPHLKDIFQLNYTQAMLIFVDATASASEKISSVQIPYLGLAGFLILLAVVVKLIHLPDARKIAEAETEHNHDGKTSVWQYKHMVLGAIAIFCYVGAEVAIGSMMINVLEETAGLSHKTGANYLAIYWGGAMIGRFIGSAMMSKIAPNKYLAFNAIAAITLIAIAILAGGGAVTMWALLLIGFFNSIMFPTTFSLATKGLGKYTGAASGIICTAIVGGALVPVVQGYVADTSSLLISYVVSAACYLYIVFFAVKGFRADEA